MSLSDKDYQKKLDVQIAYWDKLKNEIQKVRSGENGTADLVDMSETYFQMADETVAAVKVSHANRQLEQKAYIDLHTGLPNKSKCEELFHNVEFIKTPTACIVFDMNNLKRVNDSLGHSIGDQLILNFARLLRNSIPAKHFVGRYGGDEFMAVIYDATRESITEILTEFQNENFSAGPAVLPEEVLKEAADEMLDYKGTGMSVMEMSHRSKAFDDIIKEAEKDIRDLMGIPDNYKVLFLQGGASQQFAAVPMNLMKNKKAAYIITGQWAKKAYQEAQKYGEAVAVASSADKTFSYIPDCSDLDIPEDADYVYICENNTIYGTKYKTLPNTKGHTLVADVSSCFLSEPVDVTKYGVIYGGVQKNVGPAGVVIAIIREDLITDDVLEGTPTMLKWKTQADADSLYNTPPCYGIYICGKVFKWIKKMGGLEAMKAHNEKKAKILYDYLDQSKLFKGTVVPEDRSLMNVPFVTGDAELDKKFVAEATAAGFVS